MPFFTWNSVARIERAVRRTERERRNTAPGRPRWQGRQLRSRWYELTAQLDAGGTATAYLLKWDPAAGSGAGAYAADTSQTFELKDLVGQHWGLAGERLRAGLRRAGSGAVYEVVSAGAPWHEATLTAELAAGGTAAAEVTIGGATVSVDVTDLWLEAGESLPIGQVLGIEYDVHNARWVPTETACNCDAYGGY